MLSQADLSDDVTSYHGNIQDFHQQLLWVRQFAQQLKSRQHWFNTPMSQSLVSLIDVF